MERQVSCLPEVICSCFDIAPTSLATKSTTQEVMHLKKGVAIDPTCIIRETRTHVTNEMHFNWGSRGTPFSFYIKRKKKKIVVWMALPDFISTDCYIST